MSPAGALYIATHNQLANAHPGGKVQVAFLRADRPNDSQIQRFAH
jgi:hypothetical protein